MKNYLVWVDCFVDVQHNEHGLKPCGTDSARAAYARMNQIAREQAKKHLAGTWEEIILDEPVPSRSAMFKRTWERVWDLWRAGNNVLFMDSDTIIVRPVEIFGEFNEFRMFNWSTPKNNGWFANYFNCAVRYFPREMSYWPWQVGWRMFHNWNDSIYDHEQMMYNGMLWEQGVQFKDIHRPDLNFQMPEARGIETIAHWQQYNNCLEPDIKIIHYHGTRGPESAAAIAEQLQQHYG